MDTRLVALKAWIELQALNMDDPTRDGIGTDSRPPTGDDWNDLYSEVMATISEIEHADDQPMFTGSMAGVEDYLSFMLDLIRMELRRLQGERFMPLEMRDRLQAEGFSRLDAYGQALDLVRDCMRSDPAAAAAAAVRLTLSL